MASNPETKLYKKVRKALLAEFPGIYLVKVHGGPYQEAGVPDIIGCYKGAFFAIELKVGNNTASAAQEVHLSRIAAAGGTGDVSYSVEKSVQIVRKAVQNVINPLDK